jgi:translation initiation factor 2 subunit 3
MALKAKKIKNIIIVQNKIDLVDKKQALENYKKIKEFVKGTIAENSPIIPISAQQGVNINKLLEALANVEIPKRDTKSTPIFLVARSFDINRPGTKIENLKGGVLGGILKKGTLKVGDEIEIKPGITMKKHNEQVYETLTTKIHSLFKGNKAVKEVTPGTSISIETELDPLVTKTDSLSGCLVSTEDSLPNITYKIKIKEKLFDKIAGTTEHEKIQPLKTSENLMLSVNTTITVGKVEKINEKTSEVELSLKIPIVAIEGDNVGIARNIASHWRLIGWGEIIA